MRRLASMLCDSAEECLWDDLEAALLESISESPNVESRRQRKLVVVPVVSRPVRSGVHDFKTDEARVAEQLI